MRAVLYQAVGAAVLLEEMLGEAVEYRVWVTTDTRYSSWVAAVDICLMNQRLLHRHTPTLDVDLESACTAAALEVIARLQAAQAATAALQIAQLQAAHGPSPRPGDDMHETWYDDAVVEEA